MTNFDPPADPHYEPHRKGEWGGDIRWEECPECDGWGYVDFDIYEHDGDDLCPKCNGTGYVWGEDLQEAPERED